MTKQTINVGTSANDRKGDSLRTAFQKVNANFTELYATAINGAVDRLSDGVFETVLVNGVLQLPGDLQHSNYTWTRTPATVNAGPGSTVIYAAKELWTVGIKLVISIEGNVDGDNTGAHSQTCEAIITCGGNRAPEMTVYGVIHTSPEPLATFTVARNISGRVEVSCVNPNIVQQIYVKTHAVDIGTWD